MTAPNIDLLYDYLQVAGGAERVSLMLARELPARLRVQAVAPSLRDAGEGAHIELLSSRPLASTLPARVAGAWRDFRALAPASASVQAALFSGHYAPLAWHAYPQTRRLLYLHGPPLPFCLDPEDPALQALPRAVRFILRPLFARLLAQYRDAVAHMDVVVANSRFTAACFARAMQREAQVLAPPVDARFFAVRAQASDYWLSLARHEPMKRLERVIDAFREMPSHALVIAGEGSQTAALRRRASDASNIRFAGSLDTDALAGLLRGARASIHIARAEPFGLAIAESLAAGVPVLASREGAAEELVHDGVNGRLLAADPDVEALRAAIRRFDVARDAGEAPGGVSSSVMHLRQDDFVAALRGWLLEAD